MFKFVSSKILLYRYKRMKIAALGQSYKLKISLATKFYAT
jgi:hypothetical protein